MFKKLLRFLWGLVLIPFVLATAWHLPAIASGWDSRLDALAFIVLGAAAYVVFERLFSRPMRTYVFGHELTHALASMMMGGKVHSFHVSQKGGSVSLSKSNFFVALAPYCLPIYTFFVLLAYAALKYWLPLENYHSFYLGAVGFSLAFHGSLTVYAIRQEQPDIKQTGTFFSFIFIALVNLWVLVFLSKALFWDGFSVKVFFWDALRTQVGIWKWIGLRIWDGWIFLESHRRAGPA